MGKGGGRRDSTKVVFDYKMLEKYIERLDKAGGTPAIIRAVRVSLIEAKRAINTKVERDMAKPNLPAGGKYSTGKTLEGLNRDEQPRVNGNIVSLLVGFNRSETGNVDLFLMYGTPKMPPVKNLKEHIKGNGAKRLAKDYQEKAIKEILKELEG